MPGWKSDVGRLPDSIIVATVPDVQKAVRWNSPFYGMEGHSWFVSFHCFTKYVKVTFHNGASLKPPSPVDSKHHDVRYLHVSEEEPLEPGSVRSLDDTSQRPARRIALLRTEHPHNRLGGMM
jgi:hypothetical protein